MKLCSTLLLCGASLLTLGTPALAQTAAPTDTAAPAKPADAATPSAAEIIVTGSRVIKNGGASPTPLTTVSTQSLTMAAPSGTITDGLNALPVFSGSRGQFSNAGANATNVQGGNGAASVINLRNLGFYRTLVLFDGHRVPPTLYNSGVDVDIIPQELIQRVDIVTGGVSAVYGSDAVSGVVNYVLDHHFTGFKVHGSGGISQRGDAGNYDFGGSFGTKVGDNGHFEMSIEHRQNNGLLNRATDRSWDNLPAIEGAGTTANPYQLYSNVHFATYTFGGFINSKGLYNGQTFGTGSTISPFANGAATGSAAYQVGGGGAYQNASMISPMHGTQLFGRFDYDFSDSIHGFVQGAGNLKNNTSYTGWSQLAGVTLSTSNAFLPAAYQQAFAAAGQKTFTLNEILQDAPRIQNVTNTTQLYFNAGLDGKLFGDWKWDATYTHGVSTMSTHVNNQINNQNLAAALDAVVSPTTGQVVCQAALSNPSQYGNCVPLNILGSNAASAQALNYVMGSANFLTHTIQDSADASISGSPFSTWAGAVNVALSGEWRRQSFDARSDVLPTSFADCTGLRYNCTSTTTLYPTTFPNSPKVSQGVKEVAVEVGLPLLHDVAFAKSLDLNGAARYTDYSTSGKYWTWKLGGVWQVNRDIKFRGTVSRDIRAPTLFDLFQPTTVVYGNFTDTKTNTTAYLPSVNVSNPNLTSEIGHTWTAGVVLTPHFLRGTTLTFDYYHTVIDNAITEVSSFNAAIQQACYNGGQTSYCSLIQRDATTGAVTAYYNQPQNIAQVKTYGFDVEADYTTRLANRPLSLRFLANYQPHIYYIQPGVALDDQGDAGWGANGLMPSPSVQISAFVDYKIARNVGINVFERYRNHFLLSGVQGQVFAGNPYVPSYATTNLTLTFDTGSAWHIAESQMYISVSNLFDANPPITGYYSGASSAGAGYEFTDDPTGRAFVVGFRLKG